MVTNLSEASVGGQHLTENWVGLLGIVSSVATTAVSILAGKRLFNTLEAKYEKSLSSVVKATRQ
jgi:hypothetical protein